MIRPHLILKFDLNALSYSIYYVDIKIATMDRSIRYIKSTYAFIMLRSIKFPFNYLHIYQLLHFLPIKLKFVFLHLKFQVLPRSNSKKYLD